MHGTHDAQTPRGRPIGQWPPGTKPYYGCPTTSSPFVQCHLPEGFKYQGRKSKSLSFQEAAQIVTQRGTVRTKEAATTGVQAWAWQWYGSLTAIQKAALTETSQVAERPTKKARVA